MTLFLDPKEPINTRNDDKLPHFKVKRNYFKNSVFPLTVTESNKPEPSRPGGQGGYGMPHTHTCTHIHTHAHTFLRSKKKKGNKEKREIVSKQKLLKLKDCHQGENVTALAILERLEFKTFSCLPTMVADNTFQCSIASPF